MTAPQYPSILMGRQNMRHKSRYMRLSIAAVVSEHGSWLGVSHMSSCTGKAGQLKQREG